MTTVRVRLPDSDVATLILATHYSYRVIRDAYRGRRIHASTRAALVAAARAAGIALPPTATAQPDR